VRLRSKREKHAANFETGKGSGKKKIAHNLALSDRLGGRSWWYAHLNKTPPLKFLVRVLMTSFHPTGVPYLPLPSSGLGPGSLLGGGLVRDSSAQRRPVP